MGKKIIIEGVTDAIKTRLGQFGIENAHEKIAQSMLELLGLACNSFPQITVNLSDVAH